MWRWIERQQHLVGFTLSSLLRRKGKTLGLLGLYVLIVFVLASVTFFARALQREAALLLAHSPEMVVQRTVAGRHDLMPVRYLDVIRAIRGVQAAHGRLWGYYYEPHDGATYTVLVPPAHAVPGTAGEAERPGVGETPAALPSAAIGAGTAVVGNGIVRLRRAAVGDVMPLAAHDGSVVTLRIADTFSAASELVSSDLILVTEADFRRLFGIDTAYVTDVAVTVRNPAELRVIASKISRQLPDTRPITRAEILRTYESIFNWRGGMIVVIFVAAILAFVIFAWDRASGLSAEERREIGILKAIGWETADVIHLKLWEGAVLSLTAFLGGVILAYVHVFFTGALVFEAALKGWSTLYPRFRLVPAVGAEQIAALFFLTVVPYTVATIVPSWRAATIDPDTAMRNTAE